MRSMDIVGDTENLSQIINFTEKIMHLLIIEDEEGIGNFLKEGLEEENYIVTLAHDGKEGMKLATDLNNKYDLLLVDWMLPGYNGLEICKAFRKIDTETPFLFLTAKDTAQDTINALEAGANDYVKKPFDFEELLARIRVQLRPSPVDHSTLTLQDIEIDLNKHIIIQGGKAIELTQKEFALLEYLVQHKGKVCSRVSIIEKVWDIHFDYDTAVIDVYINFLRKKLKSASKRKYFKTVRGVGYMALEE